MNLNEREFVLSDKHSDSQGGFFYLNILWFEILNIIFSMNNKSVREVNETKLISILNSCWKETSFGYPIQLDIRIADSMSDKLRLEAY